MKSVVQQRLFDGKFVLIAEIGVNYYDIAKKLHISNIDAAKMMILSAKNAGIHAVKFQSYKAETLAAKESPAYWDTTEEATKSQYELFKKFDNFGKEEYKTLSMFCEEIGIEFCSTPFDVSSIDYLYPLMGFYKVSSSDLNNLPFIELVAKKNKPILLSTGASNIDEIRRAVNTIKRYNNKKITLLHCVLEYPTPYDHANLTKIETLKFEFPDCYIGYSDHTKPDDGYVVQQAAYMLGAQVIEKHYTLDKTLLGNDHYHAMDEHDAIEILKKIAFLKKIKGLGKLVCLETEKSARLNARRSLVLLHDMDIGAIIKSEDLTFKRPGSGISPDDISKVVGCSLKYKLKADTILRWDMINEKVINKLG